MAAIYFSKPILTKFHRHYIYIEKVQCSKVGFNISANNKIRAMVCMAAIRYKVHRSNMARSDLYKVCSKILFIEKAFKLRSTFKVLKKS